MSQMTNYMENKLADYARGQAMPLPTHWYLGLASAGDDASFTELAGAGYARQPVLRALATWAGTDGPGTVLVSDGTSRSTSNNQDVDWGTAGAAWGDCNFVVFYDALSAGNAWAYFELDDTLTIGNGDPVLFIATSIAFTLGLGGGMSNYLSNILIDRLFRAQAFTWPTTMYATLYDNNEDEIAAAGYARVGVAASLAAWSGTQGPGTTTTSNGSSGRMSNNAVIQFPAPEASWGVIRHAGLSDAAVLGNKLFVRPVTIPKTASTGAAPSFDPNKFGISWR